MQKRGAPGMVQTRRCQPTTVHPRMRGVRRWGMQTHELDLFNAPCIAPWLPVHSLGNFQFCRWPSFHIFDHYAKTMPNLRHFWSGTQNLLQIHDFPVGELEILGNLQFSRSHFYIVGSRRRSVFPYLQSAVPTLGKQGCENVVRHDPRKLGGANRPLFTPV